MAQRGKQKRGRRKTTPSNTTRWAMVILILIIAAAVLYYFYGTAKHTANHSGQPVTVKKVTAKKENQVQNLLNGTWVSNLDGRILEIKGNRFTLDLPSVSDHEVTKGTIETEGNTARILYTGVKDKCAVDAGIYTFQLKGKELRFFLKHDVCAGRRQIFSAVWKRF